MSLKSIYNWAWKHAVAGHVYKLPAFNIYHARQEDINDLQKYNIFSITLRPGHKLLVDYVLPEHMYISSNGGYTISVCLNTLMKSLEHRHFMRQEMHLDINKDWDYSKTMATVYYKNKPLLVWDLNIPLEMLVDQWDTIHKQIMLHRYVIPVRYFPSSDMYEYDMARPTQGAWYSLAPGFDNIWLNDIVNYIRQGHFVYPIMQDGDIWVRYIGSKQDDSEVVVEIVKTPDYVVRLINFDDYHQEIHRYRGTKPLNDDRVLLTCMNIPGNFFSFIYTEGNHDHIVYYIDSSHKNTHMTQDGYITAYTKKKTA